MIDLRDDQINELIAVYVRKTHSPESIMKIKREVEAGNSHDRTELWYKHGVLNYAGDPYDALVLLYNLDGLDEWVIRCNVREQVMYGEMTLRGKTYQVKATTPPRAVCLAALAAHEVLVCRSSIDDIELNQVLLEDARLVI
jgi:hypothetical protein